MAEPRWIKTSLFVILVLQFTAAATGIRDLSFTVRDGDEATLPCDSLIDDEQNCDSTWWLFDNLRTSVVPALVKDGKIDEEVKDKSDRLSVSETCSLVIKNVRDEDAGRYVCRRYRAGQNVQVALVLLSVVTMTEHEDADEVTVSCSVSTYEGCEHTVKWLHQGQEVDKDNKEVKTSPSYCSSSLKFMTSHFFHTSRFNSLMCEVTTGDKVQKFPLRDSTSGDETGGSTTTSTTTTTEDDTKSAGWWWFVIVAAVLFTLLIIIVAVVKRKRTKGQTQTNGEAVDPEEGVSYASVSYTKKTNSKAQEDPDEGVSYASVNYTKTKGAAQGRSKRDEGDDAVTYATVNASSANPSSLYAAIAVT
ncbi:uncharacterized protein [Clinocottus analis]|uniref:uncharacterized protein n=1 Tax=Clinocottus analis TaxID=304258 RepID=UPI0035C206FF